MTIDKAILVAVGFGIFGIAIACDDDNGPKGGTGTSTATNCPATTSGGTVGLDGGPSEDGSAPDCTTGSESGTSGGTGGGDPGSSSSSTSSSSSGTTNP